MLSLISMVYILTKFITAVKMHTEYVANVMANLLSYYKIRYVRTLSTCSHSNGGPIIKIPLQQFTVQ
jgi:hypothetical protein